MLSAAIADGIEFGNDGLGAHVLVEAAIQAGHDRPTELFDGADPVRLLDAERIADRRAAIDLERNSEVDSLGLTSLFSSNCIDSNIKNS